MVSSEDKIYEWPWPGGTCLRSPQIQCSNKEAVSWVFMVMEQRKLLGRHFKNTLVETSDMVRADGGCSYSPQGLPAGVLSSYSPHKIPAGVLTGYLLVFSAPTALRGYLLAFLAFKLVETRISSVSKFEKIFICWLWSVGSDTELGKEWPFRELKLARNKVQLDSGPAAFQPSTSLGLHQSVCFFRHSFFPRVLIHRRIC